MLTWMRTTLSASIGKKLVMALSGAALVGFLVAHLAGNLTLYADKDGRTFDGYAATLEANPLLPVAEIGLALLFAVHVFFAVRVSLENRRARASRYAVNTGKGKKTIGSTSMIWTGLIVLGFLFVHLWDFRISKELAGAPVSLAEMVRTRLSSGIGAAIYLVGVVVLGVHLSHGIRSAFQSIGVRHPSFDGLLTQLGWFLTVVLVVGFASFPLYFLLAGGKA